MSPLAAEYRPKRTCSTQNKAKRANKIVFLLLVRDQGVGGSNPLSPTNSFNNLQFRTLSQVSPWCGFCGCPSPSVGFNRDLAMVIHDSWIKNCMLGSELSTI